MDIEERVSKLEDDVETFKDHVIRCDERQKQRQKAEERYWKHVRLLGYVALGLLAMTGHDEAWGIIRAMIGG